MTTKYRQRSPSMGRPSAGSGADNVSISILFSFSLHVMVVYYIIYLPGVIIVFINFLYYFIIALAIWST